MKSRSLPYFWWRILEILPGFFTWCVLLLPVILSLFHPEWVAYFAIFYAVLWLFRSFKLSFFLIVSYLKFRKNQKIDWKEKLDKIRKKDIAAPYIKPKDILHFVVLLTFKEAEEIIRESVKSYANSNFPVKEKIVFVLAIEETDEANGREIFANLKKEFSSYFKDFLLTVHPKRMYGEIPGKSSNINFAARKIKNILDTKKIPYENVILSNFDADTIVHEQYFAELEYKYLKQKDRHRKAYQPTHFYHNNIHDVPSMVQLVSLSGSFWRMAESQQPEKYRSFSSRSNSFANLVEIDFWDPSIIPEDSRQFWTGYFKYQGNFKLVPLYSPLYMDAVLSNTYLETLKSQYLQLRRWAWGVSDFPFVVKQSLFTNISLGRKFKAMWDVFESNFFWATAPFLITFLGWIPAIFNPEFRESVLAYRLPGVVSQILTFSSIGLFLCASFTILILPDSSKKRGIFNHLKSILQWMFIPVVSVFFSAIPALDAQTRLMLNRRLDYQVTEKVRR